METKSRRSALTAARRTRVLAVRRHTTAPAPTQHTTRDGPSNGNCAYTYWSIPSVEIRDVDPSRCKPSLLGLIRGQLLAVPEGVGSRRKVPDSPHELVAALLVQCLCLEVVGEVHCL
jgi:hypothetical protein